MRRIVIGFLFALMLPLGLAIGGLLEEDVAPTDLETRHSLQASSYYYEEGCPTT